MMGTYALGFWYSGKLVADSLDGGCKVRGDCLTGGTILSTFFAIIMGSVALGQIAPPLTAFFAGTVSTHFTSNCFSFLHFMTSCLTINIILSSVFSQGGSASTS
jgi:hypothetical protein